MYLKDQGYLKVKDKGTQCQGQMSKNQFSVYCQCFCALCVMRMVCLQLTSILVFSLRKVTCTLLVYPRTQKQFRKPSKPLTVVSK